MINYAWDFSQSETEIFRMNNNLNFALYNSFLAIRTSPLQRKYKFKGCASYFGP